MKPTAAPPVSLPSQVNRHWVITGGTNGIGLEAARAAADAGADITLTARTVARGAQVATELGERGATVSVIQLDLTDLDAVRQGAEQIVEADRPVDVLVNNAGAVSARRTETPSGAELILATNVLGPFAFTNHIAPLLTGRIVITGSRIHRTAILHLEDPHFRLHRWSVPAAYGQSKLLNMLWGRALQRRLRDTGAARQVYLAHPGWAMTNIQNVTGNAVLDRLVTATTSPFAQSAADGAQPLLAAAVWELPPLSFLGPDGFRAWRGAPVLEQPGVRALDDHSAELVWDMCVRETGTDLPV